MGSEYHYSRRRYGALSRCDLQIGHASNWVQFSGKITNVGKIDANNIGVIIAVFDKSNQLVGIADANMLSLAKVDALQRGNEVDFSASTSYLIGEMSFKPVTESPHIGHSVAIKFAEKPIHAGIDRKIKQ